MKNFIGKPGGQGRPRPLREIYMKNFIGKLAGKGGHGMGVLVVYRNLLSFDRFTYKLSGSTLRQQ